MHPTLYMKKRLNPELNKLGEDLLISAWVKIQPTALMIEINRQMAEIGADPKTFKLKVLSPIYPSLQDNFVNLYEDEEWDFD